MRAVCVAEEGRMPQHVARERLQSQPLMQGQALVHWVSTGLPVGRLGGRPPAPALVDYGTKRSIARRLARAGAATVFPQSAVPDELATYDGVVLSNGPGDPEPLVEARSAATSGARCTAAVCSRRRSVLHDRRADRNADSNPIDNQSVHQDHHGRSHPTAHPTADHRGPFGWTYE